MTKTRGSGGFLAAAADRDFGLEKLAVVDEAKALDQVQLLAVRRAEIINESAQSWPSLLRLVI
jgi:hypothetical protein